MALIPACAEKCYNGDQPSYGCNFIDTACYCKQSVATQLVRCVQGNCDQTDLQSFIGWAQEACAGVGVSFDASAPSIIATTASASSLATSTSSDNGIASSGGLNTSDKIAIGIGVPVGMATILGVWLTWMMLQQKKKRSKK
ncbi:hypothetical protein MMC11_004744 [Xylographa trunciseda]|nr:hypothetical protein [Xylographa trunciseda]